jgi:soluble lytic murein transglycosylase-like protein
VTLPAPALRPALALALALIAAPSAGCGGAQAQQATPRAPAHAAPPPPPAGASGDVGDAEDAEEAALEDVGAAAARPRGRADLPKMTPARAARCAALRPLATSAGAQRGVSPLLLLAIAWVESGFEPVARSSAGARGVMQLLPATAEAFGCDDVEDDACAMAAAAGFLGRLLRRFGGSEVDAVAAYNTGPARVDRARRAGALPPNQWYVDRVMGARALLQRRGCGGPQR